MTGLFQLNEVDSFLLWWSVQVTQLTINFNKSPSTEIPMKFPMKKMNHLMNCNDTVNLNLSDFKHF